MPPLLLDDPKKVKVIRAKAPEVGDRKKVLGLASTERLFAAIQVIGKGGENNLHSHIHLDGFWFVLKGRARFYSDEKELAGELGPNESILIPRGVKYWFESAGDEPLEILQIECSDVAIRTREELRADRVDHTPRVKSPSLQES